MCSAVSNYPPPSPSSLSSSTFSFLYIPVLIVSYPSFSSLSSFPSFPPPSPSSLSFSTFSFLYIPVLIASYPSFSSLSSLPSFPSSCFLILPSSFPVIICNLFFSSNLTKEDINASQKFYFFNPYLVN